MKTAKMDPPLTAAIGLMGIRHYPDDQTWCPKSKSLSRQHSVANEKRYQPQPWTCDQCRDRVVDNPDRDFAGFISIENYTIQEEPW